MEEVKFKRGLSVSANISVVGNETVLPQHTAKLFAAHLELTYLMKILE